jgi:hypothetical protein
MIERSGRCLSAPADEIDFDVAYWKGFPCKFSGDRRLVDMMATTPDGE